MKTILDQIEERLPPRKLGSARMLFRLDYLRDWEEYEEAHSYREVISQYLQSPWEKTLFEMAASHDRQGEEVVALQVALATTEVKITQLQVKRELLNKSIAAAKHRAQELDLQLEQE